MSPSGRSKLLRAGVDYTALSRRMKILDSPNRFCS
jgi:hypothetical protein